MEQGMTKCIIIKGMANCIRAKVRQTALWKKVRNIAKECSKANALFILF